MNKSLYIIAGMALAGAIFTSCEDKKEPVFHEPTAGSFEIYAPALQDQFLATSGDMADKTTFILTCKGQPDYGFSAVCNYGAQVSLSENFVDATETAPANYVSLSSVAGSQSEMEIKVYDLAVAMCQLLDITDLDTWDAYTGEKELKLYFRGTCEIPNVAGSFCTTSNVTSYNKVQLTYAVPTPGFIYIVGSLNGWVEPSEASLAHYADWKLEEPVIGSNVYAATFLFPAAPDDGSHNVDNSSQFRFFTELGGWDTTDVQFGSNSANFFILDITNDFVDGIFNFDAIWGQGNFGIFLDEDTYMTVVCDLQTHNKPKVTIKKGQWDVNLEVDEAGLWAPVFNEPAE